MKTYIYDNTPSTYAPKSTYSTFKDFLLNKTVYKKYPYLNKTNKINDLDLYLYKLNNSSKLTMPSTFNCNNLYGIYNDLTPKVAEYLYYTVNPTYDFKVNGVPVKINGNYIIVGTTVIPFDLDAVSFNAFTKDKKEEIANVFIYIENLISA